MTMNNSKWLYVRIPQDLYRKIRILAAKRGVTLRMLVIDVMNKAWDDENEEKEESKS